MCSKHYANSSKGFHDYLAGSKQHTVIMKPDFDLQDSTAEKKVLATSVPEEEIYNTTAVNAQISKAFKPL